MEAYVDEKDVLLWENMKAITKKGQTREQVMQAYKDWADAGTYDKVVQEGGFVGPTHTVSALVEEVDGSKRGSYRVLDVGAGTGEVGKLLKPLGFVNIDALDPSEAMLKLARDKNVYKEFFSIFLTGDRLPIEDNAYDGITASGCFLEGHIPCEALREMIRIVKPGGTIVIVTRYECLQIVDEYRDRLEPMMDQLEREEKWTRLCRKIHPRYCLDKQAIVWKYRVL